MWVCVLKSRYRLTSPVSRTGAQTDYKSILASLAPAYSRERDDWLRVQLLRDKQYEKSWHYLPKVLLFIAVIAGNQMLFQWIDAPLMGRRKREITVYCGGGGGGCTWLHYVRCCRRRRRQRWRWLVIPMWGLFGAWFFCAGARAWNHGLCFVVFHYQFPLDCAMNHTQNSFLADLRVRWRHTVYILAHMSVLWMDELFF